MLRAAPAKNRKESTTPGISSCSTRMRGLPQLSASNVAKASASFSMASASLSSRPERSAGVVRDQALKAAVAAFTAASTCATEASGTVTMVSSVLGLITSSGASVPATNFAPTNIFVSSMDSSTYGVVCRLLRRSADVLALARQIVGGENRHEGHRDDENRDDVGHRTLPRPDQLGQHPDRQGRLLAGGERGHDNLVEGQREGKH